MLKKIKLNICKFNVKQNSQRPAEEDEEEERSPPAALKTGA